jgi:hypothetical protein
MKPEAGELAARPRQAGDETLSDRISVTVLNTIGMVLVASFRAAVTGAPASDDDVRCRMHQLRRVGSDSAQVCAGISMLNSNIAVLGPPERLEPLPKRSDPGQHFGIVLEGWMKERNATHARRLLRARRQRPADRRAH